jgi:hypothetical protein
MIAMPGFKWLSSGDAFDDIAHLCHVEAALLHAFGVALELACCPNLAHYAPRSANNSSTVE